ncbi:hypothetical protein MLD38_003134 [Melastoma candidum]|uniref:Uncharacterized protein n=1 Tax=Melastoma candidum TaxID=119954 RepID=A0ACB9S290_9MYRT|nr:hypothetical protein MLD38_003134 [Melastoma candidum]
MARAKESRGDVLPAVAAAALGLFLLQCSSLFSPAAAKPSLSSTTGYEEQKNYYPIPDPSTGGTPPSGSSRGPTSTPRTSSPPTGGYHGGSGGTPRPSHHRHTTASPPTNCGNPPRDPGVPSMTPTTPTYSYSPPPYGGTVTPTPVVPTSPTPTPVVPTSPTPTIVPTMPAPPTPITVDPGTPTVPAPPFNLDPNNNPFIGTYNYWRTNSPIVFNIFGFWIPLGTAFGVNGNVPGFPANYNLIQALSNTRGDNLGALYREGTASLLNSIVNSRFPYTTAQVRQKFVSSLGSAGAAGAQARLFKMANEGHMKLRD